MRPNEVNTGGRQMRQILREGKRGERGPEWSLFDVKWGPMWQILFDVKWGPMRQILFDVKWGPMRQILFDVKWGQYCLTSNEANAVWHRVRPILFEFKWRPMRQILRERPREGREAKKGERGLSRLLASLTLGLFSDWLREITWVCGFGLSRPLWPSFQ